jgi:hypothetical protein
MAIYSISRTATVVTNGSAAADVATSTGVRPRIMEIGIFLGAATASTYALNRTTALGTRTSPVALLPEEPGDPALTGITLVDSAIAHSAQPTFAATDFRTIALPATIGTGMVWTFPKGYVIAVSLSVAIVNRATNSASSPYHIVCDI